MLPHQVGANLYETLTQIHEQADEEQKAEDYELRLRLCLEVEMDDEE